MVNVFKNKVYLLSVAILLVFSSCIKDEEMSLGAINGHYYVDLGLPSGIKWATCNMGATQPEQYGNYYEWVEVFSKTDYVQENSETYGQSMNDISENASSDAVRANWDGVCRVPTRVEMEELINHCTWKWTTQKGTNGYKVTGPNGNSIFFPAAGCLDGGVGEYGYYWSSTLGYYAVYAVGLDFAIGYYNVYLSNRSQRRTVRLVSE